ncbi:beta-hydroxyacyl-ACP dehydratase [Rhodococcus sp. 06-462-5]|uniref:3-hydroxyacyl-ACP dehydratase FabZ n=1 Tax=unclassified Rhodococcus (in: high G+C Gram-positive bacteria) TaxID=192944 RepID=UPI000B9BB47E|nr:MULTISPECIES: 3-hydroxyacyl-ACP dehydratase FabZ [unclassified Rhodococcus (in: high G+C Gram-positive bacteria)]OZC79376.1 beta-hydroxyacyl-ACP dehydratase [Rhodococcus sp. 06-462-5]OZE59933.1 beta-hydroxyacyl-ACP dehydratase [Rhodococcus sp. 02-925g]
MSAPTLDSAAQRSPAQKTRTLSFGIDDIQRMLPHRWPMLMIDRAYDVVPGKSGRGIKAVSVNEPYFAGHYPGHSIMPGVMIVEAMAQLVAVVYVAESLEKSIGDENPADGVGYLGSIRSMKFNRLVVPGDMLELGARLGAKLGGLRSVDVTASVDGKPVAAGSLVVTEGRG